MTSPLDERMAVARVYAEALFGLAQQSDVVDAVRSELEEFVRLLSIDADFANFFTSGIVDMERRSGSLERMFRGRLSDLVLNTLLVVNEHDRGDLIDEILRCYVLELEAARGEVEAVAVSAVELSREKKDEIVRTAAEVSGKKPLVQFVVDPDILGGLILRIADWQFDNSLRSQLRTVERRLLERGDRGLEVGTQA